MDTFCYLLSYYHFLALTFFYCAFFILPFLLFNYSLLISILAWTGPRVQNPVLCHATCTGMTINKIISCSVFWNIPPELDLDPLPCLRVTSEILNLNFVSPRGISGSLFSAVHPSPLGRTWWIYIPLASTGTSPGGRGTFLLWPRSLIHVLCEDCGSGGAASDASEVITSRLSATEQLLHQSFPDR